MEELCCRLKFRFWGSYPVCNSDTDRAPGSTPSLLKPSGFLFPAEASLLFGRGLRAGVDRREQKKTAAVHEAELMRRVRESQGITETHEDRQRDRNRQALAESFDQANNKAGRLPLGMGFPSPSRTASPFPCLPRARGGHRTLILSYYPGMLWKGRSRALPHNGGEKRAVSSCVKFWLRAAAKGAWTAATQAHAYSGQAFRNCPARNPSTSMCKHRCGAEKWDRARRDEDPAIY